MLQQYKYLATGQISVVIHLNFDRDNRSQKNTSRMHHTDNAQRIHLELDDVKAVETEIAKL